MKNILGLIIFLSKFCLDIELLPNIVKEFDVKRRIKGNYNETRRKNHFVQAVDFKLGIRLTEIYICIASDCSHEAHVADMDRFWETFVSSVCAVDSETFATRVPNKFITPGLNSYVKDFYEL